MRRSPTLIIKVTMAHNALSGLLIRPCDRCIVAACILGSVKEVVARLTSAADQGPKSGHMTLVHSRGNFGMLFCGDVLNRRGDRRLVIDLGQLVEPGAIDVEVFLHIGHQVW
jgi:hypothetical protein